MADPRGIHRLTTSEILLLPGTATDIHSGDSYRGRFHSQMYATRQRFHDKFTFYCTCRTLLGQNSCNSLAFHSGSKFCRICVPRTSDVQSTKKRQKADNGPVPGCQRYPCTPGQRVKRLKFNLGADFGSREDGGRFCLALSANATYTHSCSGCHGWTCVYRQHDILVEARQGRGRATAMHDSYGI